MADYVDWDKIIQIPFNKNEKPPPRPSCPLNCLDLPLYSGPHKNLIGPLLAHCPSTCPTKLIFINFRAYSKTTELLGHDLIFTHK